VALGEASEISRIPGESVKAKEGRLGHRPGIVAIVEAKTVGDREIPVVIETIGRHTSLVIECAVATVNRFPFATAVVG
jgi:hypothetical protein